MYNPRGRGIVIAIMEGSHFILSLLYILRDFSFIVLKNLKLQDVKLNFIVVKFSNLKLYLFKTYFLKAIATKLLFNLKHKFTQNRARLLTFCKSMISNQEFFYSTSYTAENKILIFK